MSKHFFDKIDWVNCHKKCPAILEIKTLRYSIGKGGTGPPLSCCKTISRVLFHSGFHRNIATIYLDPVSLQGSISLPFLRSCRNSHRSEQLHTQNLFDLSTHKVYPASIVTNEAVGSYPTFSPLPHITAWRFVFCGTGCLSHYCKILPVRKYGALCCPDFPRAFSYPR